MSEHTEEHLDLCAALAVGSIDARERNRLADHIADGCLECDVALADFEQATLLLAASLPPAMPSAGLRDRVLRAIETDDAAAPAASSARATVRRARRAGPRWSFAMPEWGWRAVAAAFVVTTLAAVWVGISLNREVARLHGELSANSQVIAGLNQQLEDEKAWAAVLNSPDARLADLRPTPAGQAVLHARATFDPQSRRAVFVFENLQPPAGKVFELWAIVDQKPQSLGLITVDNDGRGVLKIENVGDPNRLVAFAVSLENPGGSPNHNAPSGPVVMMGKILG